MRFGIFTGMGNTTWDTVLDLWRHAAAGGWDAACVTDHFMPNTPDRVGDTMECWTTLAALAAVVPKMRLGTIVSGNSYRHPAVLAKMAAQVDLISGGRLICGLGAAWQQNEHEAYGIPFYTVAERLARLDEACQVLKALWTQDKSTFKGRYYQLGDAPPPASAWSGFRRCSFRRTPGPSSIASCRRSRLTRHRRVEVAATQVHRHRSHVVGGPALVAGARGQALGDPDTLLDHVAVAENAEALGRLQHPCQRAVAVRAEQRDPVRFARARLRGAPEARD